MAALVSILVVLGAALSWSTAQAEAPASVKVSADCAYSLEGGSTVYSFSAENMSTNDETADSSVIGWNQSASLEQNEVPKVFPGKQTVKGVVTAPAPAATAKPGGGIEFDWVIDGKSHTVAVGDFDGKACQEDPLPASGSSAVAIVAVTIAIPVAAFIVYMLWSRRRSQPTAG